jgi:hypothetical protein
MLGFNVSFPFGPPPTPDWNCFLDYAFYDIVHFCYLAALLMKANLKVNGVFVDLLIDFLYFFYRTFTKYLADTNQACFLQMFLPLCFNGEDKCNFVGTVVNFRKRDPSDFVGTKFQIKVR